MKVFLDADNKHFCLTKTTLEHVINYDKKLFFSSEKSWFKIKWSERELSSKMARWMEWEFVTIPLKKKFEQSKVFIKLCWNDKQRKTQNYRRNSDELNHKSW